jgi:hypothetical protein
VHEIAAPVAPWAGQLTEALMLVGGGPPPIEIVALALVVWLPLVTWMATM